MRNKFNKITSKEWLPFQKSWFIYSNTEELYLKNLRFFSKKENTGEPVLYYGDQLNLFSKIAESENLNFNSLPDYKGISQFILIDLRKEIETLKSIDAYLELAGKVQDMLTSAAVGLEFRRFVTILIQNTFINESYIPLAWDLAKRISNILSIKDEKIGCLDSNFDSYSSVQSFVPTKNGFYCLYFRKDEQSGFQKTTDTTSLLKIQKPLINSKLNSDYVIPYWFILRPQRRTKNEIAHPAKYPEELVDMFIKKFTIEFDNIIDPMSGTGSTQLGALMAKRNGYGTELSEFFTDIANIKCKEYLSPSQLMLFADEKPVLDFKIINKDARLISKNDFPPIHYMITSPPYWDMLNMRGAETQAKRQEKGLRTNYSDDPDDIGNIAEYNQFLETLKEIYFNIASLMDAGSFMTIVVKNIKKKGSNYPFAYDLSTLLKEKLILLPEVFWCQDDISIAPFGYGNTWVSNTFHQFCLTFQVPENFVP